MVVGVHETVVVVGGVGVHAVVVVVVVVGLVAAGVVRSFLGGHAVGVGGLLLLLVLAGTGLAVSATCSR